MPSRTLVLDIVQERPQLLVNIHKALADVNRSLGAAFASAGVEQRDGTQYTMWADYSRDEESWARLTDDSELPALYLDVVAPDELVLDRITSVLASNISVLTCSRLKQMIREAQEIQPAPVAWLGMACQGPYDSEAAQIIGRALTNDDPKIRSNAQLAAFLLKWKLLLPSVETAMKAESVIELQRGLEHLAIMLRTL